jgi:hypothetical protein
MKVAMQAAYTPHENWQLPDTAEASKAGGKAKAASKAQSQPQKKAAPSIK